MPRFAACLALLVGLASLSVSRAVRGQDGDDDDGDDNCPPGYRMNHSGRCVPRHRHGRGCPEGYTWDESGQCVPAQGAAPAPAQPACPPGTVADAYGRCVGAPAPAQPACPPGTVADAYGRCVPVQARPVACPVGTQPNAYGQCVPVQAPPRPACPPCVQGAREICNGCDDNCNGVIDENCVPANAAPPPRASCPPGTAMDAYGRCVPAAQPAQPVCPPGTHFYAGACRR
jgi:hypothetical protein